MLMSLPEKVDRNVAVSLVREAVIDYLKKGSKDMDAYTSAYNTIYSLCCRPHTHSEAMYELAVNMIDDLADLPNTECSIDMGKCKMGDIAKLIPDSALFKELDDFFLKRVRSIAACFSNLDRYYVKYNALPSIMEQVM